MTLFALIIFLASVVLFEVMVRLYRRRKVPAVALLMAAANIMMMLIGFTVQAVAPGSVVPTSRSVGE